uniref:Boiling soluble protein n=1 Tax=Lantana camara TaxID=126435 RepID=A0A346XQP2_LANCA|nr:boiling soluble protein [Lantana camara]
MGYGCSHETFTVVEKFGIVSFVVPTDLPESYPKVVCL